MDANHGTRWYLLALGIALSVWFGIGVVRSLNIVFALAWGERIRKVRRPLLAGAVFTVLALALSVLASLIGQGVSRDRARAGRAVDLDRRRVHRRRVRGLV